MNNENLRPIKLTHEQAVEYGRKGGLASGKVRKAKREFKNNVLLLDKLASEQVIELATALLKK